MKYETKCSFIYEEIRQRILNGQIPAGTRLPSSRVLCNQYQVSRQTIRLVFDALKKDGLIDVQPRHAPMVISCTATYESQNMLLKILANRELIVQTYKTYTLLLPPLLVFASQNCNLQIMPHYKQAVKVSGLGLADGGWRILSHFLKEILDIGGNPLLGNIYSNFELNSSLCYFTEKCPYFADIFNRDYGEDTGTIVGLMKENDPFVKYSALTALGQRFTALIEEVLKYLADTTPQCPPPSQPKFSWDPKRGKEYLYSKVISDLTRKIGSGEYPVGKLLPFEKQLACSYEVGLSTVRKALAELQRRGIVKIFNARGTIPIKPDDSRVSQMLPNPRRTREALQYIHSLQLLVLIIHPAALSAAPNFTPDELDKLDKKLADPDLNCFIEIIETILTHIELEPLRIILKGTFSLTEFGHYIAYYDNKKNIFQKIEPKINLAVRHLREGNSDAFADCLTYCCTYFLKRARDILLNKYDFNRASYIHIPEIYSSSGIVLSCESIQDI